MTRPWGAVVLSAAVAAVVGGLGALTWYAGLYTSNGRFDGLDACALLPPPATLASLVRNGAREKGDSRPKTWFGTSGGGDLDSECKWSSVPVGMDRPFRTVRIHVETRHRDGRTPAETRAGEELARWRDTSLRRGSPVRPAAVGEQGFAKTDRMSFGLLLGRVDIYDLHVRFRVSNALVDVSARTHSAPGDTERTLVLNLAGNVADRLAER
ncbi:hypothetical protein [Thermomonospora umbrina]|uniref:DUF3558 domain-containing protein n=1 Tax=Thermomonospora umbrina TaxID=111806 RepID=A0A3D9SQM5_9ACTN|nr:hypothetical protein [Thermomonospora umbrina]REE98276.1 hypothetical protein DFJ69_3760 [Thermomonospora umbrina]